MAGAERRNALQLLDDTKIANGRITLRADKGYDTRDFVAGCRERNITPHVAQNQHAKRRSAIDGRTTGNRRLRHQSAAAQASRGDLRLDEDRRRLSTNTVPRSGSNTVCWVSRRMRLQPRENE